MQGLAEQTVGRYRIIEQVGRGGMADVYKAYQYLFTGYGLNFGQLSTAKECYCGRHG